MEKTPIELIVDHVNQSQENQKELSIQEINDFVDQLPQVEKKALAGLVTTIDKYRIASNLSEIEIKKLTERASLERERRDKLDLICAIARKYLTKELNASNKTMADVVAGFKLSWRPKNPWLQIFENDLSKIPKKYIKIEKKVDRTLVKQDLFDGKELPFAKYSNNGEAMLTISKKRIK